jgi:hypothetical protein
MFGSGLRSLGCGQVHYDLVSFRGRSYFKCVV